MADLKEFSAKAKNWTRAGLGKAKDLGTSAKLSLDTVNEEENKKRVLEAIGRLFVEMNPKAPMGFAELYDQLAAIEGRILVNRVKKEELGE